MENKVSVELINTTNIEAKKMLDIVENFLVDIKNNKFQKLCLDFTSKLDVVVDECKILIKTYNTELKENNFFDKYQSIISLKLASLTKKSTTDFAEIFFISTSQALPQLYSQLIYQDLDEIALVKKLIKIFEEFLVNLKQFFLCVE